MSAHNKNITSSPADNDKILKSFYNSGLSKLYDNKLKEAYKDFLIAENLSACAYCQLLAHNINKSLSLLKSANVSSPFDNWLFSIIDVINQSDIIHFPSYFQIRCFFESTLNMLFLYKNYDYIRKICSNINYFSRYNMEVYKYSARAFLDNNSLNIALSFAKKSSDILYNDPEIHYILAEIYLQSGNLNRAKQEFIISNQTGAGYYPASKRLDDLNID